MGIIPRTGSGVGSSNRTIVLSSIFAFIAGTFMFAGVIIGALMFTVWQDDGLMKMIKISDSSTFTCCSNRWW